MYKQVHKYFSSSPLLKTKCLFYTESFGGRRTDSTAEVAPVSESRYIHMHTPTMYMYVCIHVYILCNKRFNYASISMLLV